jgi:glycosyltransferase involved in cell wall biosynthesis
MKITVGIKALNEEKNIESAITSALSAVKSYGGEVILADSGSTDKTIEVASSFPIKIFQLKNPLERCCGAGAQLAFQHANGEFFYLLDADMILNPSFLGNAFSYLENNPSVAAVGGRVVDRNIENAEFEIRAEAYERNWRSGTVDRLDGGGLYRTAVVKEVGYFADRNLHAFEEFELAARLRNRNWTLARIDCPATQHFGYTDGGYRMLWRRLKSGYASGVGELVRSAIFKPHFGTVIRGLSHVRVSIGIIVWWVVLFCFTIILHSAVLFFISVTVPLVFLCIRRNSCRKGLYSFASWNVVAFGFVLGLFRHRLPVSEAVPSNQIK